MATDPTTNDIITSAHTLISPIVCECVCVFCTAVENTTIRQRRNFFFAGETWIAPPFSSTSIFLSLFLPVWERDER